MEDLFQTVRESCTPTVWSKGVELARQDAVTGDREESGEIVLRVFNRDAGVSPIVKLYVDDGDWQCSCGSGDDPCRHVAAAVIALKRARESGLELPRSQAAGGKLAYRFTRTPEGLSFERVVLSGATAAPLTVALTALVAGRVKGPPLTATAEDMEAELALGSDRRGVLPAAVFPRLLKALARGVDVTLDGRKIAIDAAPVGLVATVADDGPGVRLTAAQDPAIQELFKNGVALCPSGLRPVVLPVLSPSEQQILKHGRFFARQEFGDLMGSLLPALEQKLPVRIFAQNLPGRGRARPRLELQLTAAGDKLTVTPAIVYGDPPLARVQDGRFVALGGNVPVRDPDEELKLKDELRRTYGLELNGAAVFTGADAVRFNSRLGRFRGDVRGDGQQAFALHDQLVPALAFAGPGEAEGAFGVRFSASGKTADPGRVLAAWRAGESLVQLLDGGYAPLPDAWLARYGARVLDLLAARDDTGRLPKAAWPGLADLADDLGETPPPALAGLRERLRDLDRLAPTPLPDDLTATLRSYQRQGVDWLGGLKSLGLGALLADDMGLGKTLQAMCVLGRRSLVVAPTSVVFNWLAELKRFRPALRVSLYHGPGRTLDQTADVVVTTYALLRLDADKLTRESWDTVVLDEAQALKNPESLAARAARRLQAGFRLALSGTPVENRLDDLWSLMQALNPGLLGDRKHFQERYARPVLAGDEERAAALRARVKPFIMRRLKREVVPELPPRTDTVLHVELSPREREHYEIVRAATRKDVLAKLSGGGGIMEALEALLRLRQAACHPDLLPGVEGEASAKLATLIETLEEATAEGHKALVFSQWTSFLDLMEPALQAAGLPFLRLDGSTSDRQAVVASFQQADGPPVLIMSLKAGGVGLNLTAADHVILTDPWWNPAAEDQAADRAHRIGQDRPVLVQRLVALGTVEERILELQERKRALAGAVIEGGAASSGALTKDDLLALLD